jgi:hypothetical protein
MDDPFHHSRRLDSNTRTRVSVTAAFNNSLNWSGKSVVFKLDWYGEHAACE